MIIVTTTAKPLILTKFASTTATVEYTTPASTKTIIDKFTVNNTDGSAVTLTIYILPTSGTTPADQYAVLKGYSVTAGAAEEVTIMKNHVLDTSHSVCVVVGTASKLVMRMSGREVVTA